MGVIEVIEPGLLTTLQDMGRYGYLHHGVPASGAMDTVALRMANILTGNPEDEACLEVTLAGPRLHFHSPSLIAISGADLSPSLNDAPAPMWESFLARQGDVLSFGEHRSGTRAYVAVAGGFDVPMVMGSKSTFMKAAIGGFKGRALEAGDILLTRLPVSSGDVSGRRIPRSLVPNYDPSLAIRMVLGPQDDRFTQAGLDVLFGESFTVSANSDRMGYRLQGPKVEHSDGPDIISDGIPFGGVQVSGDGQPIILMADRGTSGGYTKPATVISSDIGKVAQRKPGDEVRFQSVTLAEAHEALRSQEAVIAQAKEHLKAPISRRRFTITVEGEPFQVDVEIARSEFVAAGRAVVSGAGEQAKTFAVDISAR